MASKYSDMKELPVKHHEVTLCTESFGNSARPAILLIMGATASMLWWDKNFCEKLADKGFFVIRYDHRDTGMSTTYELGAPSYDLMDLAEDMIKILDTYDILQANFVGMSLGGILAQIAALKYPDRILTLTLFATGPFGEPDPTIPAMDEKIVNFQAKADKINWSDEEEVITYLTNGARLLSGSGHTFDTLAMENLFRLEFRRANHFRSMYNHAQLDGAEQYLNQTSQIKQPVLIIHGTGDKIWHYTHALNMLDILPHSSLVTLPGTGHELHRQDWEQIINAISMHAR